MKCPTAGWPTLGFTEYLVKLFDTANREHEYSNTLLKLFQLYYSAGKYGQAGETLDRAAELDPYEPGHAKRLEMLRGRIDDHALQPHRQPLSSH